MSTIHPPTPTNAQSELLDHSLHLSESGVSMSDKFDHHGHTHHRSGTSASDIEHLHSLVKQREGELNTAQVKNALSALVLVIIIM